MKAIRFALFFLLFLNKTNAQLKDTISIATTKETLTYKKLVLPAVLIGSGTLLLNTEANKSIQTNIRKEFGNDFTTRIDNYLMLVPAAQMYAGNYLGFKPKNDMLHQTIHLAVANGISVALVTGLKPIFGKTRPDSSDNLSFPSGHTAIAFTNASLLFYEYKNQNIVYASSGYLFAVATGLLRIANNRHYASDVLTGAGIGIGVGLLVSYWQPLKSFHFKINKKSTALIYPQMGTQIGLGVLLSWNK